MGRPAAAGTIYLKDNAQTDGDLLVDNSNISTMLYTPLRTELSALDLIWLRNLGRLSYGSDYPQNGGTTRIEANSVFSITGSLQLSNGTLEGVGTLSGGLVNAGTVSPGLPLGTLSVSGAYVQQSSGNLLLEIAGNQTSNYDRLALSSTGALAGTATFSFLNGFEPAETDSFTVVTASSLSGRPEFVVGADDGCVHVHPTSMVLACDFLPLAPETYITSGPAEDSHASADTIRFAWIATDNQTPVEELTYSRVMDQESWTPFLPDTAGDYSALAEGLHTFQVKARDGELLVDETPAVRSFTVDRTPPATQIVSGPEPGSWNGPSVTFTWQGTDTYTPANSIVYSYRMDAEEWSGYAHVLQHGYTGLTHGYHTFEVRGRDLAGNEEAPPVARSFRVDLEPPETQIVSGPPEGGTISENIATIGWTGSDGQTSPDSLVYSWNLDTGAWSTYAPDTVTTLTALPDGLRVFRVRARDPIGNVDDSPDTLRFTVDAVGPAVTITAGPTEGQQIPGTTAAFAWTAQDDLTPRPLLEFAWRLDGVESTWGPDTTASLSGLDEGVHTFEALARDEQDHVGVMPCHFTVDQTPPVTQITAGPAPGSWSGPNVTFTWQGSDTYAPADSLVYAYRMDAGEWSAYAHVLTHSFSGLTHGEHTFEVRGRDRAGNEEDPPVARTFGVDLEPPETEIVSGPPEGGVVAADSTIIGWTGSDGQTSPGSLVYSWSLDTGAWSTYAPDTVTTLTDLPDGLREFRVRARDLVGNVDGSPDTLRFTVDAEAPIVTITSGPTEGQHIGGTETAFAWTAQDAITPRSLLEFAWRLDGVESTWGPDTTASLSALVEGTHTFEALARDEQDHVGVMPRHFTVDLTPPVTQITSGPAPGSWNGPNVTFTWQGSDNYAPSGSINFSYRIDAGTWSDFAHVMQSSYTGLAHGYHTFEARARDLAGNEESPPVARSFRVDLEPPDTEIVSGPPEGGMIFVNEQLIGWTGTDGQTSADSLVYSWSLDAGNWSTYSSATQTNLTALPDGPREFHVRARDPVGNVDTTPDTLHFTVDASGPTVTITAGPTEGQHIPDTATVFRWTAQDVVTPRPLLEFARRLDGVQGEWGVDTTASISSLAEGAHTFEAQARDERGYVGTLARHFNVDLTPPNTEILSGPADSSWVTSPTVTFTWRGWDNLSLPGQLTFSWQLDGQGWSTPSAATSTVLSSLTTGWHTFQVRSRDLSGRYDDSPAARVFRVGFVDLQVESITSPSSAYFDQPISLGWVVGNSGEGPASGAWKDRIYLSADNQIGSDVALLYVDRVRDLLAGESYSSAGSVTITARTEGDYWIVVQTDAQGQISEQDHEGNNYTISSDPIHLTIPPHPDLQVLSISAPGEGWAGQGMEITWQTGNLGQGNATGAWTERVYLSPDAIVGGNDVLVSSFRYTGGLTAGQGYEHIHTVTVPPSLGGNYWIIVSTDTADEIEEYSEESNNTRVSTSSILLHELQYPDLVVDQVDGPSTALAGSEIEVTWIVRNAGPEPTDAPIWYERVYLSPDTVIVPGATFTLATVPSLGYLPPEESYENSAEVTLPDDIAGIYYLIVQTDIQSHVYEGGGEGNNSRTAEALTQVTLMSPFLRVTLARCDQNYGWSGQVIPILWAVKNTGEATFTSEHWDDGITLSTDPVLDGGDLSLATGFFHETMLATGEVDTLQGSVRLPLDVSGMIYLFVVPNVHQIDNVHGLAACDSLSITPAPPPDLEITSLAAAPDSTVGGSSVQVSWTVTNQGPGITTDSEWRDRLYLSTDPIVQPGTDATLSTTTIHEYLAVDSSYARTASVTIPADIWGAYYILARTDVLDQVDEDQWEGNNDRAVPLEIILTPVDLEVTGVAVLDTAWSGAATRVGYTVENTGTGQKPSGSWTDKIWLSPDSVLDAGSDALLTQRGHAGTLAPGAGYADTFSVTLPEGVEGEYHLIVQADAGGNVFEYGGEDNNTAGTPVPVLLTPPPDLQVAEILPQSQAWSGDSLAVEWRIRNAGTGPASGSVWTDALYFSADSLLDVGEDQLIASVVHSSPLPADSTYAVVAWSVLPVDAWGPLHLFVRTDTQGQIYEHTWEGNNTGHQAIEVQLTPPPDLVVTEVEPLTAAWSGDTVAVAWTVRNSGTGPTEGGTWQDVLYFSTDSLYNAGTDAIVATVAHVGDLLPDSARQVSAEFVLPIGISGPYYVFAETDHADVIYEHDREDNNRTRGQLDVNLTPPPDLIVYAASLSNEAWDGDPLDIQWTIRNSGTGGTIATSWTDAVHLSVDTLFNAGQDPAVASRVHTGALEPDSTYDATASFVLQRGVSGMRYLFFRTDTQGQVYEHQSEGNNTRRVPFTIQLHPYPDLQVTYLQGPSQATAGTGINLQWTVTNLGTGATSVSAWQDRIFLSTDTNLDIGVDILLATFPHAGALQPGGAYLPTEIVTLPTGNTGLRYLICQTDAADVVYEHLADGNNTRVFAIQISEPPPTLPDLVAADLQANEARLRSDRSSADVEWTVRNDGAYPPPPSQSYWNDSFYLSGDETLDSGDLFLGTFSWTGGLAPGDTYVRQAQLNLPPGISGTYYLFLKVDAGDRVTETDANNNTRSAAIPVTLRPADLMVEEVRGPQTGLSGQYLHVNWTVGNAGTAQTEGSGWYDSIYLSRDAMIDETDHLLASWRRTSALAAGTSYAESLDAVVPLGVSGSFYIMVYTDRNDEIYEYEAESNNAGCSLDHVTVELPPPADLIVTDIAVPLMGTSGDPIEVSWDVSNVGDNPAPDRWSDAVYVSADSLWDLDDVLLGEVEHTGGLLPGMRYRASYHGVLQADLPGIADGYYHVLVRTDLRNNVSEISETNNVGCSGDVLGVQVIELATGVTHEIETTQDQEQYFRVATGLQEDLQIRLECAGPYDDLQLYADYGRMPDRIRYAHTLDAAPLGEAILPGGGGETCYLMIRCDFAPGPVAYTIRIDPLPFGIVDVSPDEAGNTGFATLALSGGQLSSIVRTELVGPGRAVREAWTQTVLSSAALEAGFDLSGLESGLYDVRGITAVGDTALLADGFQIAPGAGSFVVLTIDGVTNLRSGRESDFVITIRNQGDADAYDVISSVSLDAGTHYRLVTTDSLSQECTSDGLPVLITTREVRVGQTAQYALRLRSTQDITMDIVALETIPEMFAFPDTSEGSGIVSEMLRAVAGVFCDTMEGFGVYVDREHFYRETARCFVLASQDQETGLARERMLAVLTQAAERAYTPTPDPAQVATAAQAATEEFAGWVDLGTLGRQGQVLYVRVVRPTDPNVKVGPNGLDPGFVTVEDILPYTVYFENLETASAPAQFVQVLDDIDPDLDWRKFRLQEVAFGDELIPIPGEPSYFHTFWPLESGMLLEIDAGIDVTTGIAHWYFLTIDPATGLPPIDPWLGFLPPNDSTGVGTGHVVFRIQARLECAPGTELTNNALIVFDQNEPIRTNTVVSIVRTSWPDLTVPNFSLESPSIPPLEGEPITLRATVRNDRFTPADSVQVIFAHGDPQQGGQVLGDTLFVDQIPGYEETECVHVWTPDRLLGDQEIRVLADPGDRIEEENETNNAWIAYVPIAPREFTVHLATGLNLVSLPLMPDGGQTAAGLASLLGATMLVRLDSTGVFIPYVVDDPQSEDFALRGGEGYVADLLEGKDVTLLGATLEGTVHQRVGYNLLSLPLEPDSTLHARTFAEMLSASAVVRYDPVGIRFEAFLPSFHTDAGYPILGGSAYFVLAGTDTTVQFGGRGWTGEQPLPGSPRRAQPQPTGSTPLLAVTGTVVQIVRDGTIPLEAECAVEISLERTGGRTVVPVRAGSGHFAAAFIDFTEGDVAREGDRLLLRFRSPAGLWLESVVEHQLTGEEVAQRHLHLSQRPIVIPPVRTLLEAATPNPFRGSAVLRYQLARREKVSLGIYSVDGRLMRRLVDESVPAGWFQALWSGELDHSGRATSGVYFARFKAGTYEASERLVLLR